MYTVMCEGRGYVEGLRQTDVRAGQGSGGEVILLCDWDWGQRDVGGGKMRTDSVVAYDQGVGGGVVVVWWWTVDGGWWVLGGEGDEDGMGGRDFGVEVDGDGQGA